MARFIIYSLLTVIIFTVFLAVPGYKQEISPLGSILSVYFYNRHTNTENLQTHFSRHIDTVTDVNLKKFYKKLQWHQKGSIVDFNSDINATWQQYTTEGISKNNYLNYWQTIRSELQEFYYSNITQPKDINTPIVHIRCSDAPFVEHPSYHLTKAETVMWMANKIRERGFDKVKLLTCNKHRRVKNNLCKDIISFYIDIFNKSGIKVRQQCNDVYTDFALMLYSPLLVSLNESSFSFMAGIAKDPNDYISCNMGIETEGNYLPQTEFDWHMTSNPPLLHSEVKDYYNLTAIKEGLGK